MKTPTIEEIISKVHYVTGEECGVSGAIIIAEMFDCDVEYKPLSELAGDRESCEKIFNYQFQGRNTPTIKVNPWYLTMSHDIKIGSSIIPMGMTIEHSGKILVSYDHRVLNIENPFKIVDFIRSLGYSA